LFRHPLGLPIPHTAIIPSRKDRIGRSLGNFVQNNFLSPEVLGAKLRAAGLSRRAAEWLREPEHARQVVRQAAGGKSGSPDAGTQTGSNTVAAPITDSDSDAFSTVGAAEFRPGRVVSRFGRKVKTVRPKLSLAGQYDLLSVQSPSVILRVRVDETGRVREVKVVKSSGSNEIDQPCQLAMYEWWFEPPRNKEGKPQPSEMLWTLSWRVR
jgi:TonB family protein